MTRREAGAETYVHGLVQLSTINDLPGDGNIVVLEVGLDLVLVDGVDDWIVSSSPQKGEL